MRSAFPTTATTKRKTALRDSALPLRSTQNDKHEAFVVAVSNNAVADHDNNKVENSIEGFCASTLLHAE
jgi:hypothetical protein